MEYLNIANNFSRKPEFIGAEPEQRGTWIALLSYCVEVENSGIVQNSALWPNRKWEQSCGITLRELRNTCGLWHFDGPDLHIWGFPHSMEAMIKGGRNGGSLGGRPKKDKTPPETLIETPAATLSETATKPKEVSKKERKEVKEGSDHHPGRSDSQPAPSSEPHPPSETPDPEKKERAAQRWTEPATDEFRRTVNESLLREPRHAFSDHERHTIGNWAAQVADNNGLVDLAPFAALHRYLAAEPRYDTRDQDAWQRIPEGSHLRLRKRSARAVIDDLANQISAAEKWAEMREKKMPAAKSRHPLEEVPDWDWEAVARRIGPEHGWDLSRLHLTDWTDLAPEHRTLIYAAHDEEGTPPA